MYGCGEYADRDGYSRINSLPTAPPSAMPSLEPSQVTRKPKHTTLANTYKRTYIHTLHRAMPLRQYRHQLHRQQSQLLPTAPLSTPHMVCTIRHIHTYKHHGLSALLAPTQDTMCCADTVYPANIWPNCANRLGILTVYFMYTSLLMTNASFSATTSSTAATTCESSCLSYQCIDWYVNYTTTS